jgi:hypothetical protein
MVMPGTRRIESDWRECELYWASSRTSIPETVALFAMGSKVRFSFPWALGFK